MSQPPFSNVSEPKQKLVVLDPKKTAFDPNADYKLKANLVPSFRLIIAQQKKLTKKILLKSWGGLGDQISSEPTIRYAVENFKDFEITLEAMTPSLFNHLKFHEVRDHYILPRLDESKYYVFHTICSDQHFPWEFNCGLYTHCVDFSSQVAFRGHLPRSCKEIKLEPTEDNYEKIFDILNKASLTRYETGKIDGKEFIVLHPGKHWQSKTFPKWWWDRVIKRIIKEGIIPILIGGEVKYELGIRTTVDVNPEGCLDLRCKLAVMETVALLKKSKVLLTNDSAPLHMAASTDCWIGFIATCKHPDYITHFRHGEFGWRMENLSLGGVWDYAHFLTDLCVVDVGSEKLESWLPPPEDFAEWGIERINSY